MDTSETYILMRLKALPDLGLGAPVLSAMFVVTADVFVDNKGDFYIHADRAPYWCHLERQDQLQEIESEYIQDELEIRHSEIKQAFLSFSDWLHQQYQPAPYTCVPTNCFETGEQLWLAFVMKEKYNKVWDGEDWQET